MQSQFSGSIFWKNRVHIWYIPQHYTETIGSTSDFWITFFWSMPLRFPELCMPFPSTQQQAYMTYIQLWKHPRYTELFQFSQGTKTGPVSAISQFSQTHTVHILYMRPTKMKQCKGRAWSQSTTNIRFLNIINVIQRRAWFPTTWYVPVSTALHHPWSSGIHKKVTRFLTFTRVDVWA